MIRMKICKCDRCGRIYEDNEIYMIDQYVDVRFGKNNPIGIMVRTNNGKEPFFDLCDSCLRDFESFFGKTLYKSSGRR